MHNHPAAYYRGKLESSCDSAGALTARFTYDNGKADAGVGKPAITKILSSRDTVKNTHKAAEKWKYESTAWANFVGGADIAQHVGDVPGLRWVVGAVAQGIAGAGLAVHGDRYRATSELEIEVSCECINDVWKPKIVFRREDSVGMSHDNYWVSRPKE